MDNALIAALLLACTTVSFALQARRWKKIAQQKQEDLDQALSRSAKQRQQAHEDGLFTGWKRGWGESYASACKAERKGLPASEAIMRVGKLNAPALIEEDRAVL